MKSRSAVAAPMYSPLRSPPVRARPRPLFAVADMRLSAGLLLYRRRNESLEVLLAHLGGPLFASKDLGVWGVPKGDVAEGEGPLSSAKREFARGLGHDAPQGPFHDLGFVNLRSGSVVYAYAVEAEFDPSSLISSTSELEWPPMSGRIQHFAEVDRVEWFDLELAHRKLTMAQSPFLQRLANATR